MPDIKKKIKFEKQQNSLFNDLLNILNYNNDNVFYLYDLDNNKELQDNIMNLVDNIIKYYPSSNCNGINKKKCKRPYLSIIRYLVKYHNKNLFFMDYTLKIDDNKTVRTKKYKII